jgi:DNA mismatch endonuclease (patch repair protein)
MADVFDRAKRSEVMSRIRARGNKDTELALLKLFRREHIIGWRRGQLVFGKPDFVFRRARLAIFVDGCFWHGCPKHCKFPASNANFWKRKLEANQKRDTEVTDFLEHDGWSVIRIWECHLAKDPRGCLDRVKQLLQAKDHRS